MHGIVASDFKFRPYWWEAAPPVPLAHGALAPTCDVAIVGAGITGAAAALALARAGRSVAVFDKDIPGSGASRRAAGFMGRVLKKSFSEIAAADGMEAARRTYRELDATFRFTLGLIEAEGIECHLAQPGRFIGATSHAHYAALEKDLTLLHSELGYPFRMVPASETRTEMATDAYLGGAVIPDNGSLHPGLYHKELLDRALASGAQVFGSTEVLSLDDQGESGCVLRTTLGEVKARHVIIATNGYTPGQFGWYHRRVVPFRAYMAATEELPADFLHRLLPNRRTVIDSNVNIDFFRVAPDSPRLLFGGATAAPLDGPESIAARMHEILRRILPEAGDARLSHVWDGYCAGTFDLVPHMGSRGAIHYALGYNFVGITTGTLFGHVIAQRILGTGGSAGVFEGRPFPTMPLYTGNPWFLGLVMRYFDWQDRRLARSKPAA